MLKRSILPGGICVRRGVLSALPKDQLKGAGVYVIAVANDDSSVATAMIVKDKSKSRVFTASS